MAGRRITFRFVVFVAVLALLTVLVIRLARPSSLREATITSGSTSETWSMQAVVMRDETVLTTDSGSTVYFAVGEGALVSAGDAVADVYTASYSAKERAALETIRSRIRAYHAQVLENILDSELDRLDAAVQERALELRKLVSGVVSGSVPTLETQLAEAMERRRLYLSQNRREDATLNSLYEDETKRLSSVESWKSELKAPSAGLVSFYLDGCEEYVSPGNLSEITADGLRGVLAGAKPDEETRSRLVKAVCRVTNTERWYLLLIVSDERFSAVTGQTFRFQFAGFEDVIQTATAVSMQSGAGGSVLVLEVTDPIGPFIGQRGGTITLGAELDGLYVPAGAVITRNGQTGVLISDGMDGSFVPVQVLARDSGGVLVEPVQDGSLRVGQRVLTR